MSRFASLRVRQKKVKVRGREHRTPRYVIALHDMYLPPRFASFFTARYLNDVFGLTEDKLLQVKNKRHILTKKPESIHEALPVGIVLPLLPICGSST